MGIQKWGLPFFTFCTLKVIVKKNFKKLQNTTCGLLIIII